MNTVSAEEDDSGPGPLGKVQPRQLIVTVYGLYARDTDGWMSVASLIQLLADLGVEAPTVRSCVSRLKRAGLLEARTVSGAAGYRISPETERMLRDGDPRIFAARRATVDEGWVLVVFSVPESERARRHTLRTQLTRLGFGSVSAGVWIAPGHVHDEAESMLARHGLRSYADLFRADYLSAAWGRRRRTRREGPLLVGHRPAATAVRRIPRRAPPGGRADREGSGGDGPGGVHDVHQGPHRLATAGLPGSRCRA